jgi:LmbE family N-acetylglucosaminyl deacetylase
MATVVFFHAHPDDESILTGGTMSKLAAAGHRVVLVTATRGEHGEVAEGVLADGETLGERRTIELEASARALGVTRLEFLGYVDSGMAGTAENDAAGSFHQADLEEAASRLAAILRAEACDTLVVYDEIGGYGHPDHVKVHQVGLRAGELAGTPVVYEATIDRDRVRALMKEAAAHRPDGVDGPDFDEAEFDESTFGMPAARITTRVDVSGHLDAKRAAMVAHPSQISETSWFLMMPAEQFAAAFGEEHFIRRGGVVGSAETELAFT